MIVFLSGILTFKNPTYVEIDVGGVGYGVHVPFLTFERLPETGKSVCLSTFLHVREDALTLFGFHSVQDRNAFIQLLSVSGIGPKVAIAILSTLSEKEFHEAVLDEDVRCLSQVPGIGKKTAERLIFDLKDKISRKSSVSHLGEGRICKDDNRHSMVEDSISALITLGYSASDSRKAIRHILDENQDIKDVEELVRRGLKKLLTG